MTTRTYPYQAWVLMPSFKPVEVTIEGNYGSWNRDYPRDVAANGKSHLLTELHATKAAAIEAGWVQIEKQEAELSKKQANIYKRREALRKASL